MKYSSAGFGCLEIIFLIESELYVFKFKTFETISGYHLELQHLTCISSGCSFPVQRESPGLKTSTKEPFLSPLTSTNFLARNIIVIFLFTIMQGPCFYLPSSSFNCFSKSQNNVNQIKFYF